MSCGAAELWEASGLPEKRCAHPYCIPAPCACTSTVHQHFHACISERFSTACVHFYSIPELRARISIIFEHFGMVGVIWQFFRLIGVRWAGRASQLSQQASYPTLVRECEGDKHGRVVLLVT